MTKNIGKSIKTRLLNLAKEEKQDYMKVLVRYLHERLLFRISASPYKSHFLLKGSSLLFALDGFNPNRSLEIFSCKKSDCSRLYHRYSICILTQYASFILF